MASVQDVLVMKALQDASNVPDTPTAVLTGGSVGAGLGALGVGGSPKQRLAGSLVGLILGGALGAGTREMMIQNSPGAAMLAKIKSGTFTESD